MSTTVRDLGATSLLPLEVLCTSPHATLRSTEQVRKGHNWVEADFCHRGAVMAVRLSLSGSVTISCPTAPATSVTAQCFVRPEGLAVWRLERIGLDPRGEPPEPHMPQPYPGLPTDGEARVAISTDRTRTPLWRGRLTTHQWMVSARLENVWKWQGLWVELYADGLVWIASPGTGVGLRGRLGPGGLDLGVHDQFASVGTEG